MLKRTLLASSVAFAAGVGIVYLIALQAAPRLPERTDRVQAAAEEFPAAAELQRTGQRQIAEERRSVIVEAVQRVAPSVASVQITGIQRVPLFDDPFYRNFFGLGPTRQRRMTVQSGSAFMISSRGEFLTNEHVVAGAESVSLLLPNGDERVAEVVGTSPELDLALLRIDPEGLEAAPLGTSGDLFVGEWLVAVGFPVGGRGVTTGSRYQPTVTVGVVSAVERSFTPSSNRRLYYARMIQTDAAINPGNSGGPIANAAGHVVGINTFILSDSGGSQGLGFAIPIDRALRAVEEMRIYGRVRPVDPGNWTVSQVNGEIARELDLDDEHGLLIREVAGPAATAGLRADDVVLSVDGTPVDTIDDVRLALLPRFVGEEVTLGVMRDGRYVHVTFVLDEATGVRG